jgi:hypothetical protein
MNRMGVFFIGYLIVIIGIVAALWHAGVLAQIGFTWTAIGVLIALGLGIMFAVASGGPRQTIDIDRR